MPKITLPMDGACRCGQVRFRVSRPPLLTLACHCRGCQRMSASAYSLGASIPSEGFEITAGEPAIGGLHGPNRHYFCPHCMSWVYSRPAGMDWFVNVRPTLLERTDWFSPFVETYRGEGLAWATTPAPHSFEGLPEMDAWPGLIAAYAAARAD